MKKKIDTSKWKYFSYQDFFELISDGKKLSNKDIVDNGHTPVYSSSTTNNGCFGYTEKKADYVISENRPIYLIFGDHTKSMSIIKEDFSVMDNVKVLVPKITNEYCIRFITTVWQKCIPNLGYARHWTIAQNIKIPLPVDSSEKPNWNYMENYMIKTEEHSKKLLKTLNLYSIKSNKIDIDKWKEFLVSDIFEIKRPTSRSQSKYDDGNIPFVASGNYNNGVLKYLTPKSDEKLDKGNCITVSPVDGSAFYQENDFLGRGGAGSSIIMLYNDNLNRNIGLFIATVIRKVCSKYLYNNMGSKETISKEIIKLPVDYNGNPDWKYMNNYIDNLEQIELNTLNKMKAIF